MAKYVGLIPQNAAPYGATNLAVFNKKNEKVLDIPLGSLELPDLGEKLYSFGAISDVHIDVEDAESELQNAFTFFNENADFVCICGDLTNAGTAAVLQRYKNCADQYSTIPVYATAGNHEFYDSTLDTANVIANYTGHPMWYSFNHGNDLFIMTSYCTPSQAMSADCVQWIYNTLEENRNKRCFLFNHGFLKGTQYSGDVTELYWQNPFENTPGLAFKEVLTHYHNVTFFHGHSHELFEMQEHCQKLANRPASIYDNTLGCHSVHIPSLSHPIDISSGSRVRINTGVSQGYLVDVYENHIVLRGREFTSGKFLPIANYCLDTTIKTIEGGTFTDSTGTIKK